MRYRPRDFANNGKQTATAELRQLETPNQATVVLNVRLDNGARLLKVQGILPATIKNLQLLMSTTPPSSPPLLAVEVAQKPAEKRSHEQMNEPAPTPEIQTIERPARPEILPRFSRSTSPLKPGQTPPKKSIRPESSPAGPTKNAAQQQQQGNIQVESSFARSSEDSVQLDSHPKHPIELFDWDKFEERFCNTMTELETREDKLYEEFTELTQVRLPHVKRAFLYLFGKLVLTVTIATVLRSLVFLTRPPRKRQSLQTVRLNFPYNTHLLLPF